jgi:hypothetical protein
MKPVGPLALYFKKQVQLGGNANFKSRSSSPRTHIPVLWPLCSDDGRQPKKREAGTFLKWQTNCGGDQPVSCRHNFLTCLHMNLMQDRAVMLRFSFSLVN